MPIAPPPLGGLSPKAFLRDYWQKRPLLVRQAVPGFGGFADRRTLVALATSDATDSRLIERTPAWRVTHGPIDRRDFARLPDRNWTLLVNGLNLHSAEADALLARFSFVPWTRLDDVMVSHAVHGGGVGPHVDSYDVFLLQGPGRRRWRLMPPRSDGTPFRAVANAPLKLIAGFKPTQDITLEPGDMLYLPPGWGHDGVAIGTCQTYSIGFRAPGGAELSAAFLDFLHERGFKDLPYSDPDRKPTAHPARLDAHLIDHALDALNGIRWSRATVAEFLARHLSEPKQYVVFDGPRRPMGLAAFLRKLPGAHVRLDSRSRMLTCGSNVYINGAGTRPTARARAVLSELADKREVQGDHVARVGAGELLYDWYRQGFLHLARER